VTGDPSLAAAPDEANADRPDSQTSAGARSRWRLHVGLIASFVLALIPLLLFSVGSRITIHVAIACCFLALVPVHLAQRRRTAARLVRQLVTWTARSRRWHKLALSDAILAFLVVNVLASGVWDYATGRNQRIPGLQHFIGWHPLSSALLICYLAAHVLRRRRRLRTSQIR
jgi:hypothetical protein